MSCISECDIRHRFGRRPLIWECPLLGPEKSEPSGQQSWHSATAFGWETAVRDSLKKGRFGQGSLSIATPPLLTSFSIRRFGLKSKVSDSIQRWTQNTIDYCGNWERQACAYWLLTSQAISLSLVCFEEGLWALSLVQGIAQYPISSQMQGRCCKNWYCLRISTVVKSHRDHSMMTHRPTCVIPIQTTTGPQRGNMVDSNFSPPHFIWWIPILDPEVSPKC